MKLTVFRNLTVQTETLIKFSTDFSTQVIPNLVGKIATWENKNIHRDIVSGMKAISINRYPSSKKFESDKKIKPMSSDIKHNLNLKGEFLFLKI